MPPGEARRMGAPAAAPPLAVPQPEFPAAGSPPRTVQMRDQAVPREAPPVVPMDPEPVVQGGGLPPTHGMQGAAPWGGLRRGNERGMQRRRRQWLARGTSASCSRRPWRSTGGQPWGVGEPRRKGLTPAS